ncbi:MAG TPA: YceK/YidQ family lipoprotein [Gemmataceae bacterium]|jgi:uncharacterized protein YceK
MRPRMAACLAALLASALGGCGTFVNCVGWNGPAGREIYGGVKQDAQNGKEHLTEAFYGPTPSFSPYPEKPDTGNRVLTKTFCAGCGIGMLGVDLPISFVADTLTLPVTIPATLMKKPDKPKRKPPSKSIQARVITSGKPPTAP